MVSPAPGDASGRTDDRAQYDLPRALVEYADHLLLGTGLDAPLALQIASGRRDAPDDLVSLAAALRAGWQHSES